MKANVMKSVKVFANEFISLIINGNENTSNGYEWQISYDDYYDGNDALHMKVDFVLYDYEGEECGELVYDIVRNERMVYTYSTRFAFCDEIISDSEELEKFNEIKDVINMCEAGLYNKICAYLHKFAMEQMDSDECKDDNIPPSYEPYYSPSIIENFMKEYGISPYVPIDVEVVDDRGLPIKYLSIKGVGFNDEGNRLIVSLR